MAGTPARGGTVTAITGAERTLGAAVDAFLAQPRPVTTARTYTRTLERLAGELGRDRPLADVTDEDLDGAASRLWGGLAPRTWNRHLATVGSFLAWCRRHGWPAANLAPARRPPRRARGRDPGDPAAQLERRGPGPTSRCGSGRCGGCCTTPPPAPKSPRPERARPRPGQPAGPVPAPRAAISDHCISRPAPPGCWPGSLRDARLARCSSLPAGPPRTG